MKNINPISAPKTINISTHLHIILRCTERVTLQICNFKKLPSHSIGVVGRRSVCLKRGTEKGKGRRSMLREKKKGREARSTGVRQKRVFALKGGMV